MTSKQQPEMDKEQYLTRISREEERAKRLSPNILEGCKEARGIILAETGEDDDTKLLPTIEDMLKCLYKIPDRAFIRLSELLTDILGEERAYGFRHGETGMIENAREARDILRNISTWLLTIHVSKATKK